MVWMKEAFVLYFAYFRKLKYSALILSVEKYKNLVEEIVNI
jgi:hypothetical protein